MRMTQDIEDNESETQIGFDNGNNLLDDDNVLGNSQRGEEKMVMMR